MTASPSAPPADLAPPAGDLDGLAVATIRVLAAEAVQAARSGHPGLPLGTATVAWALYSRFLRHDPSAPRWPDRDRFVLSAGHGSALQYVLLHLFGYDLSLDELRRFRQWGSRTPGHPEYGHTPGVETTTGPLGQGLANAVGMALAERMLAARCAPGTLDHRTWVLAGDGDLMEGVSHEAASLAGHLGLGRLNVVFDDNDVTIDGPARQSCSDDVLARFAAYGWHTVRVADGNDLDAVTAALQEAAEETARPTLVAVRTVIGFGSPVAGTPMAHGAPLGDEGVASLKARLGWPDEPFHVPAEVAQHCADLAARGTRARTDWERRHGAGWHAWIAESGPHALTAVEFPATGSLATRVASGAALRAAADTCPALVGGSADLAGSTGTALPGHSVVTRGDYSGRTVHFGIREHAMAAVLNGIALHGGLRPFGSTFLVFSDYLRPALRLSALMELPVVYVFTHDSIMVGEDGPTHQPVEHVEALRLVPGLAVLRPADAHETAACWELALRRSGGPTALVLSRQDLPVLDAVPAAVVERDGARTVREPDTSADVVLVATGSEVSLALAAADTLAADGGPAARVVSVPWRERAAASGRLAQLVPTDLPAVWIEAGAATGWHALARPGDRVIGLDRFGASGPGAEVYARLGFTAELVATAARAVVQRSLGRLDA